MRDEREKAMRRHPAGRAKVEWLIADGQNCQSTDDLYRLIDEVDAFMGGPAVVPESAEVRRQRRMDLEACAITTGERWWSRTAWGQAFAGMVFGAALAIVVVVACWVAIRVSGVFGAAAGGWPL